MHRLLSLRGVLFRLDRSPIGYEAGDNQYAYVEGRPVKFVDSSGLEPVPNWLTPLVMPYSPGIDFNKVDIENYPTVIRKIGDRWQSVGARDNEIHLPPSYFDP